MKKNARVRRRKPVVEEIEPRILYSADFAPSVLDPHSVLPQAEQRTLDASGEFTAGTAQTQVAAPQSVRHEVVFVDTAVPDYQKLVQDITANSSAQHQYDVVLLKPGADGIKQITQTLAGMHDVSAVHIISHGADGEVQLGGATLNFDSLLKDATQIKSWSKALAPGADLLIYGCDVAEYADGKALVNALSRLTGANVAASENLTGAAAQGGDWKLEYSTGGIDTPLAISTSEQFSYSGTLATIQVTNTSDTGAGSLRQAITTANASAGVADTITFNLSTADPNYNAATGTWTITVGTAASGNIALPVITAAGGAVTIDGSTQAGYAGNPLIRIVAGTVTSSGANARDGLSIAAANSTVRGLAISGFTSDGIQLDGNGITVAGNYIGTNVTGTAAAANGTGININSGTGDFIGSAAAADRNVISGNTNDGIFVNAVNSHSILGNFIGTNATATAGIANGRDGIRLSGNSDLNTIGGIALGAGNVIAFNTGNGVNIIAAGGDQNAIRGNAIYSNTAGAITLQGFAEDGATDPDTGANQGQNYPDFSGATATITGGNLQIAGITLASKANTTYAIDFYAIPASGTGQRYIGTATGITTNAAGNVTLVTLVFVNKGLTAGDRIVATATNTSGAAPELNSTSPFSATSVVVPATGQSISGTIYEDLNGDGSIADGVGRGNVTVRLYADDHNNTGNGIPDLLDQLVATTTTNAAGLYTFNNVTNGNYFVIVDSKTITPSTALNGGHVAGETWADETYATANNTAVGTAGAMRAVYYNGSYQFDTATGAFFGGLEGNRSDDGVTLSPTTAVGAEHIQLVSVSNASVTNVNSAYSFNVVTNTQGGNSQDDDPANARTVQGSLRQFIQNANAISGANTMRFVPAVASNQTSGTDAWWQLAVTTALPQITDASTTIDGTAYSSANGTTVINSNTGSIGTGGTVGTGLDGVTGTGDELTLSQVARPELEIRNLAAPLTNDPIGLDVNANNVTIQDLSIWGFGSGAFATDNGNIVVRAVSGTTIQNDVIGTSAHDFVDPGTAARSPGPNIIIDASTGALIQNNLIGYSAEEGVRAVNGPSGFQILGNEIRGNGQTNNTLDGIGLVSFTGPGTIRGNLIASNVSPGIDIPNGAGTLLIDQNTITGNAFGAGSEQGGIIARAGASTTISHNVITGNTGSGVIVAGAGVNAQITQNSISGNIGAPGLGIDLVAAAATVGDGVTANDVGDGDPGGNALQNFPVITSASSNGTTLTLSGTLNSNAGNTYTIEFFASPTADALGYGEGQVYVGSTSVTTDGSGNASFNNLTFATSVVPGWVISATATNAATKQTSEFSKAVGTASIAGTIYEDVNGNGSIADDGVGRGSVSVSLYNDNGNGVIDAGDAFVASTATNAAGLYNFGNLATGTYYVVVDSKTITPTAGFNAGFTAANVWADQTYGVAGAAQGAGFLGAAGPDFGGRNASTSDNASALTTAEHVTKATISGTNVAGINSGFSFNVVDNVRGDATDDDGGGTARLQQGSLRQFILNADAIAGPNAMRFVPAVATNASGSGGTWWDISVATSALPIITDASTTIDGTAYSSADGVTVVNSNSGQVGTGGTVGVDGLTLDKVNRPELELTEGGAFASDGISINAGTVTVRNLAVNSFSGSQIYVSSAVTGLTGQALITGNLVGTHADGTNAGGTEGYGIRTNGAATITNNYVAYQEGNAIMMSDAYAGNPNTQAVTLTDNEIAFTTYAGGTNDAVSDISNGAVIRGNYIHDYIGAPASSPALGKGIEVWYQTQNALIEDNTITGMRTAGIGINDGSHNNTIDKNVITGTTGDGTAHSGAGILITSFTDSASSPPTGNIISQNSISGNAGLGIDLDTRTGAYPNAFVGDGVTLNNGTKSASIANLGMDFPVITSAVLSGSTLTVAGYVGSAANQALFAGAIVEIFKAAPGAGDSNAGINYGEGQTYLGTLTADANGNLSGTLAVSGLASGDSITGTARDASGNTSEFGADRVVDVPPTLATGSVLGYTENQAASAINAAITTSDVDNATLASATVAITGNYASAEDVLGFVNGAGMGNIAGSWNAGTGVMTLTSAGSTATVAQWQTALRAVTYFNSSDNPSALARTVSYTVNDGTVNSNTVTSTLNVTPVDDAPVLAGGSVLGYTENQAASAINAAITTSDVDNATLASATVAITGNYASAEDVLGFVNGAGMGNIAGSWNAGTGVMTLTSAGSTATVAQWQTALRAVTYFNSSDNPSALARTVSYTVNDGTVNSNTVTSTLNVTPVDDAPVLAGGSVLGYTENQAASAINAAITTSDVDNATLASATVAITGNYASAEDVLGFVNGAGMGNIAGSWNAGTGVMTLTSAGSTATVAQWQTALRAVTYFNSSDNPSALARTVSYTVNDGTVNSNTVTSTLNVTPVDDAPVLAGGSVLGYTENQAASAINAAITTSDVDNATLASATVAITGNYASAEDVLGFVNGAGMGNIAGSWNAGTGVMTLTSAGSTATVAQWQTALRAVTYFNSSDNPSALARTVSYTVNDGTVNSNTVTSTLNVTPVDDAPVLAGGSVLGYTENQAASAINAAITTSDVDNATLASATVAITGNYASAEDVLGFVNGAGMGNIAGSWNAGTGVMTLTSAGSTATVAQWQTALRAVTYFNSSDNPSALARTVSYTVNDGTVNSNTVTSTLNVTPVDDAPVLAGGSVLGYTENQAASAINAAITTSDVDNATLASATVAITGNYASAEDVLGFVNGAGMGNIAGSWNAGTGVMTLTSAGSTATVAQWQTALRAVTYFNSSDNPSALARTVSYTVNDGTVNSNTVTSTLNVTPVDDAPVNTVPAAQSTALNTPITFSGVTLISVADVDDNGGAEQITLSVAHGTLSLSGTGGLTLIAGANATGSMTYQGTLANLNGALNGLLYTPNLNYAGPDTLNVATDDQGNTGSGGPQSANSTVNLTVLANQPPTLSATTLNPTFQEAPGAGTQAPAVNVFSGAAVNTVEPGQNIIGLNFSASGLLDGASERIVVDGTTITLGANSTGTTAINGMTYNVSIAAGTATVNLINGGGVSSSNIASLVNGITYQNTNTDEPSTGNRVFALTQIQDSGGTTSGGQDISALAVVSTVNVVAVNDAPTAAAPAAYAATEQTALDLTNTGLTVGDVDALGGSETVTLSVASGVLNASAGTTGVGVVGSGSSSLMLTGSIAQLNNLLTGASGATLSYINNSDAPPPTDTLTLSINDNGNTGAPGPQSAVANSTINVTPVNDAPVLATGGVLNYTENDPATAIDTAITVNDVDNATLSSATVAITGNYVNGEDVLGFVNGAGMGNIAGSWNAATGVMTLSSAGSTATLANWQSALQAVSYANSSDNPSALVRTVSYTVNDGAANSNSVASTINVTPVNDAPVLATGGVLNYTENDPATAIDTAITVNDVDNATLSSATVAITGNYVNGEDVLGFVNGAGMGNIAGSWNAATGVMTLSSAGSTATLANWQSALQAVSYANSSDNPSALVRTVSYTVNDGAANSNSVASTINVTPVNDAPVLATGGVLNYTENDPATAIDTAITVNDVDNATLSSATVAITGNYVNGEDVLGFVNGAGMGNIAGSWNAATGVMTLSSAGSTATLANWQSALQAVSYANSSDNPSALVRTVSYTVNDGAANSNSVASTINVTPVNDAPVLATGGVLNYTENDPATAIDTAITVNDVDNATLSSATVAITGNYVNGEDVLGFVNGAGMGNIAGSWNAATGVMTLSSAGSTATLANWQSALQAVSYANSSDNPSALVRTVSYTVNDGAANSNSVASTINVTPVNDAPVLATGGVLNYTENDPATAIDTAITVNDVDNATLSSATVAITGNYVNGEDVLGFVNGAGMGNIAGSWNAATGVMTLSSAGSTATLANWQSALQAVSYANSSDNPSALVRTVSYTVNDGAANSNSVASTINVTPVNDAPVLATGGVLNYTENDPATAIDTAITVNDVDNATLSSATVAITGNYVNGEDVLGFVNGAGMGNIAGSWNAATGVMTLSSAGSTATLANWQSALQAVSYANSSDNPSALVRTVSYTVNDGAANSNSVASTINVTPVNDAPVLATGGVLNYTENDPATAIDTAITVNDVDNATLSSATVAITGNYVNGEDVLGFVNGAGMGNIAGSWNAATGVMTLSSAGSTATLANWQSALQAVSYANSSDNPSALVRTVSYTVNDGAANSNSVASTINVTPVNDAPVLATGGVLNYTENDPATAIDTAITVNDVDNATLSSATVAITGNYVNGEDVLGFVNGAGMGNIAGSWNAATGVMTLSSAGSTATLANWQSALQAVSYANSSDNPSALVRTVSYTVNDGAANSNSVASTINVTPVNDAPVLATGGVLNYTENDPATAIDTAITVNDVDNATLSSATVAITGNYVNGEDVLGFVNGAGMGNIAGSWNAATGVMTLSSAGSTATLANWQSALQAVSYANSSDNPSALVRTVSYTVNDGAANSNSVASTINVTPVNDAPVLATGGVLNYTENDPATAIDTAITVNDVDNATLSSATVAITGNYVNGEDVLGFVNGAGMGNIAGSWNAATGVMTLSSAGSTATLANWQSALQAVSYANSSDNPSALVRTVSYTVNDGAANSNSVASTINVTPVNDAPVLATGGVLNYTENDPATAIDTAITVNDVDNATLSSATVAITGNYVNGEDVLGFVNGAGMGNIAGSWNAATGVMTLSSAGSTATLANWQSALQAVSYANSSDNPSALVRTVSYTVNDGAANSNSVASTINVTPVNDAPVLATGGVLNYTENDPATAIDTAITVNDVDNATLSSATVAITGNYVNGEDVLGFVNGAGMGNIAGSWNAATGVMTLSSAGSTATLANWQSALQAVSYANSSDNPSALVRTVSYTVNDGAANSNSVASTINVTPVNDAPVLATGGVLNYTENDPATAIDTAITVNDVDNATLSSATVAITGNYVNGEDVLGFVNGAGMGNIAGSWNAATGVMTLSSAGSTATLANWQSALQAVSYANSSDNPSALVRTVSYTVNDGAANSNSVASTINVTPVNDAPVLATGGVLNYTENDPATAIDTAITVNDVDNATLSSATVAITGNYVNGEDVLGFVNGAGMGNIAGSWNAATGVMTLSSAGSTATLANWQSALQAVSYANSSDNPSALVRTVSYTVNDGAANSNSVASTINVTPVNDAPVLATGGVLNYTENDPATAIDTAITVNDVDNATLSSATVAITGNYVNGEDVLGFVNGAGMGNIAGSWNAATGVMTLSSAGSTATLANWQSALQAVSYANSSDNPSALVRTVSYTVNDGAANSNSVASTINVTPVNDAPVLATGGVLNYTENDPATAIDTAITVNDVDNATLSSATVAITGNYVNGEDVLGFVNGAGMGNIAGSWNAATGVMTLSSAGSTATLANWQSALQAVSYANSSDNPSALVRTVSYTVNDGAANSNSVASTINVTPVNDAPVLATGGVLNYTENDPATAIDTAITVNDVDNATLSSATVAITGNYVNGEDVLGFVNGAGMGNIAGSWNAATGVMTLSSAGSTATLANWQSALQAVSYANSSDNPSALVRTVSYTVNDGAANSNSVASTINVTPVNDAPVLATGGVLNYTENDPATAIDTAITVNDVDNATLSSATVAITGNYVNGEDVLGFVNGAGMGNIAGSWNAATGVMTLSSAGSTATLANWQSALQAVSYANSSDNPSALVRTVSYTVNDGAANSNSVASTINVTPVNDAPVLGSNTLTIAQGGSVIFSSANLSATDVDNPAASLTFTMSNVLNGHFELVTSPGVPITTFTQATITGGQVRFVDSGSTAAPAFDVTVSDGTANVGPSGATIVFSMSPGVPGGHGPVIAPPPVVAPMPTPNPVLAPPPPAPSPSNPTQPALTKITTLSGGRPMVAEAVTDEPDLGGEKLLAAAKVPKVHHNPAPLLKPANLMLVVEGTDPHYMEFGPNTQVDWSAQTAFPGDHHDSELDRIEVVMETVRMGGIALSVGVVWWASRVTGLIGSLLASMPAWRHLDPLPIVGKDEDKDEENWYEPEDSEADADELAISMVLDSPRSRDAVNA